MAFDSIENASFSIVLGQIAKKAAAGLQPRQENDICINKITWGLGTGAVQINEAYIALLSIVGAGNQVLDLTALTDVLGNAWSAVAVKAIFIQLLSPTDFSTDKVTAGTLASSITVGNNATNPWSAGISDQATGTITIINGGQFGRARDDPTGWPVDATHKSLKFLNNDALVTAKVLVGMQGV